MKVTVYMLDGSHVEIRDMDTDTVQPMVEALLDDDVTVLALTIDESMTYVMKANVTRVDVD